MAKGNKINIIFYIHQDQEVYMVIWWSEYKRYTKNKEADKGHCWKASVVNLAEGKGERRVPSGSCSQQETYLKLSDCGRGEGIYFVYIDFKRPLDKVSHTRLLSKLGGMSKGIFCIDKWLVRRKKTQIGVSCQSLKWKQVINAGKQRLVL